MLMLGLLGASRSGNAGKFVAVTMVLLFGYILMATYWVKLIPLYAGFEGRTSLSAVAMLYKGRLSFLMSRLNVICLVPAAMILLMSGLVSIFAVSQQVILIRLLFVGQTRVFKTTSSI